MKLKCPKCLFEYDHRQATKDQAIIAIIQMQGEFGFNSDIVFEYAELFETTRPLKPTKLLRILTEVLEIWKSGSYTFDGRSYRISKAGITQALTQVCSRNLTALNNHNYLKKVMNPIADQEAEKKAADEERTLKAREARIRATAPPENLHNFQRPAAMSDALKNLPWSQRERKEDYKEGKE